MGKMTVYHGSYTVVEHPEIIRSRYTKDFDDYDMVIGAMANDQIYNYVADYIDGVITREQFWSLAKFKYPTHQINFATREALKCLEFVSAREVME